MFTHDQTKIFINLRVYAWIEKERLILEKKPSSEQREGALYQKFHGRYSSKTGTSKKDESN